MRLILFDIDGTLLNTAGSGRESTRDAMLEVFGTASTIMQHKFGGKTDWYTLVELLEEHGFTAEMIGAAMPSYERVVARHLTRLIAGSGATACPGAWAAVEAFRQQPDDTLLGLVTGNCASTAPIKLKAAGYDPHWFPVGAFGSESLDRNDLPKLALQRAIAHSQRQIAPDQVVVIGDTLADIACARALGALAVAVTTGHATREALEAAQPDILLDDLAALPGML